MAPFISLRCLEQTKCALAMMDLPVTIIAVGVGLGYADSGPTHYLTEDIACMRAIAGLDVLTARDCPSSVAMAELTLQNPKLRYIRLDRDALPDMDAVNGDPGLADGFDEISAGEKVAIVSSGFLLHRANAAKAALQADGLNPAVIDLYRIKPLNTDRLAAVLSKFDAVVSVEEQCLDGGFGSAIGEFLLDQGVPAKLKRLGLPERYYFENGGRNYLLDRFGLGTDHIAEAVRELA